MNDLKKALLVIVAVMGFLPAFSQIGYQVAVVDQATGNPKANNQVEVSISLLDNAGNVICNTNETLMTNDFGVVSVSVGNSSTFDDFDWTKLPLWISAKVDGIDMGKTQVLTVPVAEHAKHTGTLTKDLLCSKTWSAGDGYVHKMTFSHDGSFVYTYVGYSKATGKYSISGDIVVCKDGTDAYLCIWSSELNGFLFNDENYQLFLK